MDEKYYAHSLEGKPPSDWQPLEEHLQNVAKLAADFARPFGGDQWAYLAGLLHDFGKGSRAFQAYLRHVNDITDDFGKFYVGKVDHSTAGAQSLYRLSNQAGKLLAYCVAGHHSGLLNWVQDAGHGMRHRLAKTVPKVSHCCIQDHPAIPVNLPLGKLAQNRFGFQLQFFVRMIFSSLVDADFLDTENFIAPDRTLKREVSLSIKDLSDRFRQNIDRLVGKTDSSMPVNQIRNEVLTDCLTAAEHPPGLFSLTVPTGGGKTLSSLAFALAHALKYDKHRIIYAIPFTSIIEQNARVFRNMLGEDAVLEHHSNFVPDDADWRSRLAAENWDMPVIVTTNVQFFDSFFSNKTSKCRKLHNVANSVVIFDEVQAIPVGQLSPCLEVLRELTTNYGVTAVLCTATQPAFDYSPEFTSGLSDVREIATDVPSLFSKLKRTEENYIGECSIETIAQKLRLERQVLCVVNTRKQALKLFKGIKDAEDAFHLSALMYPAHRSRKLEEIRDRLSPLNNLPCRVVSTQLIEAGVDIDFPVVFRSMAGMDSIAQAAGRCNREGRLKRGEVYVFKSAEETDTVFFRQTAQSSERLLNKFKGKLLEPSCIRAYFKDYYWLNQQHMDEDHVYSVCCAGYAGEIQFEEIARFRMIKNAQQPIVIAVEDEALDLINQLKYVPGGGMPLRKLQQYSVQVYPEQFNSLRSWLEQPYPDTYPGVYILRSNEIYSEETGLLCEPPEGEAFFG